MAFNNCLLLGKPPKKFLSNLERQDEPWLFGINPSEIDKYLSDRGFVLIEDVGASDYKERYLNPIGRQMNLFEGERVVLARVEHTLKERK